MCQPDKERRGKYMGRQTNSVLDANNNGLICLKFKAH
jgi:hypothetical protein